MKSIYQTLLLAAAVSLAACTDESPYGGGSDEQTGTILLPGVEVSNVAEVINESRAVYDVSDFIVDFYRSGETDPYRSKTYSAINGAEELPVGKYTLQVRSHEVQTAEWDNPYFVGSSAEFSIEEGKITEIDPIVCKFSSVKVTVVFGTKLRAQMGNDVKVVVKAGTGGELTYTPSETRAGYFDAPDGSTTMGATFTGTINGAMETEVTAFSNIEPGQHRIITYELSDELPTPPEPTGSADASGVSLDIQVNDVDLTGNVDPGSEDVLDDEDEPGQLPSLDGDDDNEDDGDDNNSGGDGGDDTEPITFGGTLENGKSYYSDALTEAVAIIYCTSGCQEIEVTINSTFLTKEELTNVGLTDQFKLVSDTQYAESLGGLGLPCGDQVKDQTTINFDITQFMGLLAVGGESTNVFTLDVTDNDGNSKSLTFTILCK